MFSKVADFFFFHSVCLFFFHSPRYEVRQGSNSDQICDVVL